jgi:hypothetical protein
MNCLVKFVLTGRRTRRRSSFSSLHSLSHDDVILSDGGDNLECLLLEHRHRSTKILICSPPYDRIGPDQTPSPLPNRIQRRFQCNTSGSAFAVPLIYDQTGYSLQAHYPGPRCHFSIFGVVFDSWQLIAMPELAPTHRLSFRVDEYPMRTLGFNQFSLLTDLWL